MRRIFYFLFVLLLTDCSSKTSVQEDTEEICRLMGELSNALLENNVERVNELRPEMAQLAKTLKEKYKNDKKANEEMKELLEPCRKKVEDAFERARIMRKNE